MARMSLSATTVIAPPAILTSVVTSVATWLLPAPMKASTAPFTVAFDVTSLPATRPPMVMLAPLT